MINPARNRIPRVEVSTKSPLEDFLFILVISLAVTISFFAKKQMTERFALAEHRADQQVVTSQEYEKLPKCVMGADGTFVFEGASFLTTAELIQHISTIELGSDMQVVLKIDRTRSVGEVEDIKNALFDRNIQLLTEWEKHK